MKLDQQRQGLLFVLLSVTGYSLLPIWVKPLQDSGLISLDIMTLRFALATPIFWAVVLSQRVRSGPTPRRLPVFKLLGMGGFLALAGTIAFWGLERLPAGTFVVLFYTYPAMVAVLSALLGERLNRSGWAALGLTLAGVFLSVPDFGAGLGERSAEGVLLAMAGALTVALYFLVNSRLLKGHSAVGEGSALTVTGALLALLAVAFLQRRTVQFPVELTSWLNLLALAGLSTVFTVFFLTAGIQKVGPTRASIFGTFEPILTVIFSVIFLHEQIQPVQLLGGGLIVLSVVLLQARGEAPAASHQSKTNT